MAPNTTLAATGAAGTDSTGRLTDDRIEELLVSSGGQWVEESFWKLEDADLFPFARAIAAEVRAPEQPSPATGGELPPMPKPECLVSGVYAYRDNHMAAYARLAILADRAARSAELDVEAELRKLSADYEMQRQREDNEYVERILLGMRDGLSMAAGIVAARRASPAPVSTEQAAGAPGEKLAHGHRDDYYLLANARRIGMMSIRHIANSTNWMLAHELFATGSNSAHQICVDAGIDPYGYKIERAPSPNSPVGAKEQE